ncbi:hypothetical protein J6590_026319 [Homalodisca vitripennis]|nr:hypothetical protein J6590_026319 [Homalodisca vitripennis]
METSVIARIRITVGHRLSSSSLPQIPSYPPPLRFTPPVAIFLPVTTTPIDGNRFNDLNHDVLLQNSSFHLCRNSEVSPLLLNLRTNGLKVTSEPPPMAGQTGCLQGKDPSAFTHPSSSHARRCSES